MSDGAARATEDGRGRPVIRDRRRFDPTTGEVRAGVRSRQPAAAAGSRPAADSARWRRRVRRPARCERTADLQRLQAEYANYRRRVDRDRQAVARGGARLGVRQPAAGARRHRPGAVARRGRRAGSRGRRRLEATLTKLGLERFGEVGEPFDPTHARGADARLLGRGRPSRSAPRSCRPATASASGVLRPAGSRCSSQRQPRADRRPWPSRRRRRSPRPRCRRADSPTTTTASTARHDRHAEAGEERRRVSTKRLRREGLLRGARRRQGRDRRRDQEGVPQAGPQVSPGREPGRRQGRGEVQGGLRGLRRALRPEPSARSTTRRARCSATAASGCQRGAGACGAGGATFDLGDLFGGAGGGAGGGLGDLFGGLFGGGRGVDAAGPRRGADVEAEVTLSLRRRRRRRDGAADAVRAARCPHLRAAAARSRARRRGVCPRCSRHRHGQPQPGWLRLRRAVPRLPRQRPARRRPVPDLPRHRRRPSRPDASAPDPGRRRGRPARSG